MKHKRTTNPEVVVGNINPSIMDKIKNLFKKFNVLKPNNPNVSKKRRNMYYLSGIIIIVILVSGFLYWNNISDKKSKEVAKDEEVVQTSYNQVNSENFESAEKSLKSQLDNNIENNETRYKALTNLGIAYFGQKKYDLALETLLEAEKLKQLETGAIVLEQVAQLYTIKGDKDSAITYYKKTIARVKQTPESADDGYIPNYEGAIKYLGGSL